MTLVAYYLHVTPWKNLASILRYGLSQKHGESEYAGRFESLEGVYMTTSPGLIEHMREMRADLGPFALVLIQADPACLVPDEDLVDIVFNWARTKPGDSLPRRKLPHALAEAFHEHARNSETTPFDRRTMTEIAKSWLEAEAGSDEADPDWWARSLEALLARYPDIRHPLDDAYSSVRYKGDLDYGAVPGIAAVIDGKTGRAVKGAIPEEAKEMVEAVMDVKAESQSESAPLKIARERLFSLATQLLPDRDAAVIDAFIVEMGEDDVRRNLSEAEKRMEQRRQLDADAEPETPSPGM